jgi:HK97 family phage portal protein
LWGNAYAKISRDKAGKPIDLMPLHPDRIKPMREAGTLTYHYFTEGKEYILAKDSVLHIKGFGIDGTIGLSPIDYARNALGITVSADVYASKAFSTNQRPPGYFAADVFFTPEQRKQLQERYGSGSIEDMGRWILEGGVKWHDIGPSPDEVQMLQSRAFQLSELSRFFLIPPHLIGAVDKSTSWGTGIEQQNIGFLTYVLAPYFNRWEKALNRSLLTRNEFRTYYVEHSVEGFLRADSAGRAAFYASGAQNGWLTRNEIRKRENLPPKDGGDDLTIQVNLTPADQLTQAQGNGNENPTD